MLDLLFMGTAPFAVPSLRALLDAGYPVRAVVSQPDRPTGRGMKLRASAVKELAVARGVPVLQPEKASEPEFLDQLRGLQPDIIVVVAYGQILRTPVLELPSQGCINVHGSLLPELRGAAPIQWAILRGHAETGVTTMFMDRGMDTGDMILKAAAPIHPDDTAGDLAERLAPLGAELLLDTLRRIQDRTAPREPQDPSRASYAPMLRREDGAIRWEQTAVEVRNRAHGCNPAPGAFARRGVETVKIWRAEALPHSGSEPPGTVLDAAELVLATGGGALRLVEVQPENRARMQGAVYRRGYRVQAGERWENGLS